MQKNKAVALNMIANVLSFGLSLLISFFLTPYITQEVGIEAYGLIGLANSLTNYITVITAALNSMASRFIIIEFHKRNQERANIYFNSVLIANTVFALLILIPSIWLLINIKLLNISDNLIVDARITFVVVLLSFLINLIGAFYGIVLYAKNMLWKGSMRTAESYVIRIILIISFFSLFSGKVYYVVLATFIAGLYVIFFNVYYTKKYMPELKINARKFSFSAIKELISAGIWNSITKLSQILLDGLDLLLSNLFINGVMTGNVSIGKTIPSLYTSVVALLSDSFYPVFLEYYSTGKKKELMEEIKNSITVLSMISGVCLSFLIVYAKDFYQLWIPSADSQLLYWITLLSTGTVLISGCIYSLFSVFSLTNNVRENSIALIVTGVLSIGTTYICLEYTDLGVYAIVGVSSIYGILRNLTFTPIYAAKCLKVPRYTFYPVIVKNLCNIGVLFITYNVIKSIIPSNSWGTLILSAVINIILGIIITLFLMFNKKQRNQLFDNLKNKLSKK